MVRASNRPSAAGWFSRLWRNACCCRRICWHRRRMRRVTRPPGRRSRICRRSRWPRCWWRNNSSQRRRAARRPRKPRCRPLHSRVRRRRQHRAPMSRLPPPMTQSPQQRRKSAPSARPPSQQRPLPRPRRLNLPPLPSMPASFCSAAALYARSSSWTPPWKIISNCCARYWNAAAPTSRHRRRQRPLLEIAVQRRCHKLTATRQDSATNHGC